MVLREVLTTTQVGELTLKSVPVLSPRDSVAQAAAQMREHSHGSALVCDAGKLAGVFTERDLIRFIAGGRPMQTPLAEVMTAQPRTVQANDSLLTVVQHMDQGGYRRLPVVDASGAPVGIVDVKTLVHFLVEHFPAGVYNQASHAHQLVKDAEGA